MGSRWEARDDPVTPMLCCGCGTGGGTRQANGVHAAQVDGKERTWHAGRAACAGGLPLGNVGELQHRPRFDWLQECVFILNSTADSRQTER